MAANYTGKTPKPDVDWCARWVTEMRRRLRDSASGYITVRKLSQTRRLAMRQLMEAGEAEQFESPLGPAYRLIPAAVVASAGGSVGPDP